MSNLFFLENRSQVLFVKESLKPNTNTKLIAVTAEALQTLEEVGLEHETVSKYADSRQLAIVERKIFADLFPLTLEIERYIAQKYSEASCNGPGFLSGQIFLLQHTLVSVVTRVFFMMETIRKCKPDIVTVFSGVHEWFEKDGYLNNPWVEVVCSEAVRYEYKVEIVTAVNGEVPAKKNLVASREYIVKRSREMRDYIRTLLLRRYKAREIPLPELSDLTLLMVDSVDYDWAPVLEMLRTQKNSSCFLIQGSFLDNSLWTRKFNTAVIKLGHRTRLRLDIGSLQPSENERAALKLWYEDWQRKRSPLPELNVLGIDFFPVFSTHLCSVVSLSLFLLRHADTVAGKILDEVKPKAVCFYAATWLNNKRLMYQCRLRNIPTFCYQHGGAYGTLVRPPHSQTELQFADYFLSYGEGIEVDSSTTFPTKAKRIPVGSARIEAMISRRNNNRNIDRRKKVIRLLWIGEFSWHNTGGSPFQVEDIERYCMQRQCISILGNNQKIRLTYRPYTSQLDYDGTTRWIKKIHMRNIRVNSLEPLEILIRKHDLVITDTTSGTVWNEVLALKKPLILYCDPRQTYLMPRFAKDLEKSCYWCKSQEELMSAVYRLVRERKEFITTLEQIDTNEFVEKYVLHKKDGRCVQRVISVLGEFCRKSNLSPAGV